MGWSRGSTVASSIIEGLQKVIRDDEVRRKAYVKIIKALEDADWDCQNECEGMDKAFDQALKDIHPDWY